MPAMTKSSLLRTAPDEVKFQLDEEGAITFEGRMIRFNRRSPFDGLLWLPTTRFNSELATEPFPERLDVLFDHGYDDVIRNQPLGSVLRQNAGFDVRDDGLWIQGQILRNLEYQQEVVKLLERAGETYENEDGERFTFRMGLSGAGLYAQTVIDDDEVVRQFVPSEVSLTPIPSNPGTLGVEIRQSLVDIPLIARFNARQEAAAKDAEFSAAANAAANAAAEDTAAEAAARQSSIAARARKVRRDLLRTQLGG